MDPFIGEIRIFAGDYAPYGWALCNGQIMQIVQNTALFSLLGVTYGGDGKTTFALPDLRDRAPMHWGNGPGLTPRRQGQPGGSTTVTLTQTQMPAHTHVPQCNSGAGAQSTAPGNVWGAAARGKNSAYTDAPPDTQMNLQALQPTGGAQAHNNMQPYLGLTFIIATQGIFPQRP